jgi:hypothetical protein
MNTVTQNPSREAILTALAAFRKGEHTEAQLILLLDALPPDVRESLQEEAGKILNLDFKRPDAYGADGQPLWNIDMQQFAAEHGLTDGDLADIAAKYGNFKPDPKVKVFDRRVKLAIPPFTKSDQTDENGDPIYWVSSEGAGLLTVGAALSHNTGEEQCPKAVDIFNYWMALARQKGVSPMVIERLTQATHIKADTQTLLADIARVTQKVSAVEAYGVPVVQA